MIGPQAGIERRVSSALDAVPSRIPIVLGGCGTGRTSMAERLRDRLGRGLAQYIDVERSATTPERFLQAVTTDSPFPWHATDRQPATPRESFDALLAFFNTARAPGGEAVTFILDEVLELRTFESFPGLRHVVRELLASLATSPNRFVLTSRYMARARRILRDASQPFEIITVPPMSAADVTDMLAPTFNNYEQMAIEDRDHLGRAVQALTAGRVSYVAKVADALSDARGRTTDPVSALVALLSPGAPLERECRFTYELRLHRARGYGALKAILDILALEEPLTLTEISIRLRRTPGSTKDYLSWLEDVDLVTARQKRYSFADPLMRLWVRLHCRSTRATQDEIAREVQNYTAARVPLRESAPALAYAGAPADASPDDRKNWGIIEID
ncbi:MAG: hypothetical protein ABL986_04400 [Vicinamibacterales bacterium]